MLHVRDVRELEQELRQRGELAQESVEGFLKEAAEWFETTKPFSVLDRQTFAQLCDTIRIDSSEPRRIACGALRVVREQFDTRSDKSRFVSRFAVNRVSALTNKARRWSGVFISEAEYAEALELFDVARGDVVYTDDVLSRETKAFIRKFENSPDMFGRLAEDLACLVKVVEDRDPRDDDKEAARAALVYFLETSDAIPDDLGPVGYLDDAIVVAHALNEIQPERAVLTSYLDRVVNRWPFLLDVALEAESVSHPLSEYSIVNAALLLSDTQDATEAGVALVVPDTGPLAFLLGFLISLADIHSLSSLEGDIEYAVGDRLMDRHTGEEYLFEGYVDSSYSQCETAEATHFAARQPKRKGKTRKIGSSAKSAGDVTVYKPIEHLAALQPSVRETKTLRTGEASIDLDSTELGALERLFGRTEPITLPKDLRPVVVVSGLRQSEDFARAVQLYGIPLSETLPMGSARCEDEVEYSTWTRIGQGGRPAVIVVRSTSEALELAERFEGGVRAVVAPLRSDTTDAANVSRLAADGYSVLALVEERDQDSQEALERGSFSFWSWDDHWLDYLHWPPSVVSGSSHQVASYETRIRTLTNAKVDVVDVEAPFIDIAFERLRNFEDAVKRRDDESMQNACSEAVFAFLSLLRTVTADVGSESDLLGSFQKFVKAGEKWWPEEVIHAAKATSVSLSSAAAELRAVNPKKAALDKWVGSNPNGIAIGTSRMRQQFDSEDPLRLVRWMPSVKRGSTSDPLVVPGWLGRATMERVLSPPASPSVTLILYAPERSWFEFLRKRRSYNREKLRHLSRARSAIHQARQLASRTMDGRTETLGEETLGEEPFVDHVLTTYRRKRALDVVASDQSELVESRLVFFSGGYWAAFSPKARIHTFTHVLDNSTEEDLPERPVVDLQPGDRVLMVRGSDRGAVAHAADRVLPHGARQAAGLWQLALRRYAESDRSVREVRDALAGKGCARTMQTIRGWINDEHRIGPREPIEETLSAIHSVTGDSDLSSRIDACAEAIRQVRGAHISAGRELQDRVLERVKEWLDDNILPEEVVEVEEQVLLLAIEAVDPEPAMVSRNYLNRLREDS